MVRRGAVEQRGEFATFIERGREALMSGGVVAVPTETQYALSVLASDGAAVMHCFALKRRPDCDPMPIFLPDLTWLDIVAAETPAALRSLAAAAWPGPLTLVLPRHPSWRSLAVPGKTVAVRIPQNPLALALLAAVGEPITGSSANRHGEPAPVSAIAVHETFGDAVTILPPMGVAPEGTASTILDCTAATPRIVRAGALDEAQVGKLLSEHLAAGRR